MSQIISFVNQKGGVGKTTSAINTATMLSVKNFKVLLIDMDPQGSSTSGVGIMKSQPKNTAYEVLIGKCDIRSAIIETRFKNLHIIPSNVSLAAADYELISEVGREFFLKKQLASLMNSCSYDYIIIDCPLSIGLITINALSASNSIIIPLQCEYYALEGLSQLMLTIKKVKQLYNPRLFILGILVTMFNSRLKICNQVHEELKKYYEDKLFKTKISRTVMLCEAPSYGEPIYYYAKYSKPSLQYEALAEEIISRTGGFLI
ncbi:MAG: ParA family protein [Clostridia bacterium]|nr:ParA family protein [Clostridia bacterium]